MHRWFCWFSLCALPWAASGAERVISFAEFKLREHPPGFRSLVAGGGPPGDWRVVLDTVPTLLEPISPLSPVSAQRAVVGQLSADSTDERFPLLVWDGDAFGDFTLSTRFKINGGEHEQLAGVAFRLQDERNFYYVRASVLSGTLYFLKVVDGVRGAPIGSKFEFKTNEWYEIGIECAGTRIRVLLNGREAFPALEDRSLAAGRIALLTKSDARCSFGDLRITYRPREILAQTLVDEAIKKYDRLVGLKIYAAGTNRVEPCIIASTDSSELGQPAPKEERDVLARGTIYSGKTKGTVIVTMPLHDSNGDVAAAVRVVMNSFPGQTEKNSIIRAAPVVKMMEARVQRTSDLFE
jgi:hypothetical protein